MAHLLTRRLAGLSIHRCKPSQSFPKQVPLWISSTRQYCASRVPVSTRTTTTTPLVNSLLRTSEHQHHPTTAPTTRWFQSTQTPTKDAAPVATTTEATTSSSTTTTNQDQRRRTYALVPCLPRGVKLKPHVVKKRLSRMRTYVGSEKGIRHSPWRMNLVCQFAAGLTVPEALVQLQFCHKAKAPLVAYVVQRTANLADIRDGLKHSQLEVAECFATHGTHLKRLKIMAKGRSGIKRRRHSHIRVVIREIDFDLKILQARSMNQKKKWLTMKQMAEEDAAKSRKEREELEALEKATQERAAERAKK